VKIAFIDVETTGLDPERDEIVDLCVRLWEDGKRGESYSKCFLAHGPISPEAQKVNGYDPEKWWKKNAVYLTAEELSKALELVNQAEYLGGAATAFDRGFLHAACDRLRLPRPKISHRLIDVQSLAVPFFFLGQVKSLSLGAIDQGLCGGNGKVPHNAPGDVDITINVFEALVSRLGSGLLAAQAQGAAQGAAA
jgi:DNA polymerase III epsilon subunit-like protein